MGVGGGWSVQMAYADIIDRQLIFCPDGHFVHVIDGESGKLLNTLRGHFGTCHAVVYRSNSIELYSGGEHRELLLWTPFGDAPPDLIVFSYSYMTDRFCVG